MSTPARPGRAPLDLSVYLVTDTGMCGARGVPATVEAAVAGGVSVVQLRDHDLTDEEFVALGRQVREVLAGTGVPLIVDDRVHLVEQIGADGAHVGQRDVPAADARSALGPDRLLGLSVSTPQQVRTAIDLDPGVLDYLGVGPMWATATKPGHADPLGPDGVAEVTVVSPWPCVAIGGIDVARAPRLRGRGLAGIAVVSAICAASDPCAAAAELRRAWGDGS
ncbi:thiamine phosphate synthase [Georgenia alba]|uniref:Thiamine-phosphate synthase n=1 Tax=Georgenia alba TaxID=2233858 RepID=A0ABW2Q4X9_9MICO